MEQEDRPQGADPPEVSDLDRLLADAQASLARKFPIRAVYGRLRRSVSSSAVDIGAALPLGDVPVPVRTDGQADKPEDLSGMGVEVASSTRGREQVVDGAAVACSTPQREEECLPLRLDDQVSSIGSEMDCEFLSSPGHNFTEQENETLSMDLGSMEEMEDEQDGESSGMLFEGDCCHEDSEDEMFGEDDDDGEEEEWSPERLGDVFAATAIRYTVSKRGASALWKLVRKAAGKVAGDDLGDYRSVQRRVHRGLPKVLMDVEYVGRDGQVKLIEKVETFPAKEIRALPRGSLKSVKTYVSLEDLKKFHLSLSSQHKCVRAQMSVDGVPVSKSCGRSLDITSIKFEGCKNVYPLAIVLPEAKVKYDFDGHLRSILAEFKANSLELHSLVADIPKRASLRCMRQQGGYYACGYCEVPGIHHPDTQSTIVYPAGDYASRTSEGIKEIASNPNLPKWTRTPKGQHLYKGVIGYSPLLDFDEDFDFVHDLPADYMHLLLLGVCRETFRKTFVVAGKTPPGLKLPRQPLEGQVKASPDQQYPVNFNELILEQKVPLEFKRRPRKMDISNFKASEWRTLLLVHFPVLLKSLHHHQRGQLLERWWTSFVFYSRALFLPQSLYDALTHALDLQEMVKSIQVEYEELFGTRHCTLNVHMLKHLLLVRERYECLTSASAFPFESSYQFIKSGFAAGTQSVGKQIIYNVLLRLKTGHSCVKTLSYRCREKSKQTQNDICVTEDAGELKFWKIREIFPVGKGEKYLCQEYAKESWVTKGLGKESDLDFSLVGVYRNGGLPTSTLKEVWSRDRIGKGLEVCEFLIFIPKCLLLESD